MISTGARCEIDRGALGASQSELSTATHRLSDVARRVRTPRGRRASLGAVAAAALAYVAFVDPHRAGTALPRCPVKLITGLDCPSCGGMRLLYDVMHGDVHAALHDNPYLLACSPLLALLLWRGVADERRDAVPATVAYTLGIGALAWMLVRNVPGWPLRPIVRG